MSSVKRVLVVFLALAVCLGIVACAPETPTVTVSFETFGGTDVQSVEIPVGDTVSKPQDPTYGNMKFGGWFKDTTCTDMFAFDSESVSTDITLYALWIEPAACGIEGHYVGDGLDHRPAPCGVEGHYSCDGQMHNEQGDVSELPFFYGEEYPMDCNFTVGFQRWESFIADGADSSTSVEIDLNKSVSGEDGSIRLKTDAKPAEQVFAGISKYIHIPGGDAQVSFVFSAIAAADSTKVRVSVKNSDTTEMLHETTIGSEEWTSVVVDFNDYKEQNVTVVVEAVYDDGEGARELYLDNLSVVVDDTIKTPFVYDENHPVDSDFMTGTQGWEGFNSNDCDGSMITTTHTADINHEGTANGTLVLRAGSVTSNTTDPLTWFSKYVAIPDVENQDTMFELYTRSIGVNNASIRISVIDDSGRYTTITDWKKITGDTWIKISAKLNDFKGTNIYILIEQGFDGEVSHEEILFIDDVRVYTCDPIPERIPFEYTEEHPVDSDFMTDMQGWVGGNSNDCDGSMIITTHTADINHQGTANGTLVLRSGSVSGNTTNALTWVSKYITIPDVAGFDTMFELYTRSIGANNANIRVSIIDADGIYKVMTAWQRISGDEWKPISVNLNDYRGTNIDIVIEQGFDGEVSNEEILFIDDIRVFTSEPADEDIPFEYNEDHPMDSDFIADNQGWVGENSLDCDESMIITRHTADISCSGGANGTLVLRSGSKSGNTTDPLTWFKKYIAIPNAENQDAIFELYTRSIGANNANIRVSLIDAEGQYTVLTDWEKISGDNWIKISANLNAYKGTNVYMLIEQGFDGEVSHEEILFIDDIRVYMEEPTEQGFEYNEEHPVDSNFMSDTQGWIGGNSDDCDQSLAVVTHTADINHDGAANGTLVLRAGSKSGNTTDPLTWFKKYIAIPNIDGHDAIFELYTRAIGANNANIRISVMDSEDNYTTLTEWQKITGDTWINISADLNAYKGTSVYILIEQGFDGEVSNEEILFIDDIRVYTKQAAEQAFEYNEQHPVDSNFMSDTQGWIGGNSDDCDQSLAVVTHTADINHEGTANGTLVLRAGSKTGNTTDPLTWFKKYIAIPDVEGQDAIFELYTRAIGANNANIRISVIDDEGNYTTLTEWQKITGDEWINISADLNAYKGTNVYILIEQGFDGEVSHEEILFIDDIRVYTNQSL